ncbi:FimV/HubP family polar landmark protein [Pseudomonas fontis]|uniref:Peptidoglycan-binding protein n=1 Tax=Pseudomonas fontis TaxID=2942633 RepID=A0ABT5P0L8_9PSED|nr:FimV/HubP family polar landmark protein [Pseudomonas fontis]MDD0975876.1 peptidoglycan-binding protein [Pseudomonas fontis]MDD0993937.1 peptidoglycan-binding protein [Pseudomonas fontis]
MLRIRKLVLAIAAASALSSGMAHALGLGELTLKSAQNQPLDAEIELLDVNGLSAAEVVPSLAPAEEFSKAGVERQAFLNDLKFTPVINPSGKSVLRVTSSQPLSAPMVKFLVQVMWPQGRLLRDYSVLIDPSKFSPEAAKAAAAVSPAVSAPKQYTTVRRDTLWEIASRARQGGSVQQTMLAIQALNPDAFINGNINQLKTGQVLRLPDQQQIQSIAQPQAVTEVAEQYAAWRQGRRLGPRARQLDATHRAAAEAAPARIAQQDNLRLVSPGGKGAAGSKALADKLATTQETLDTSRREGDELKGRVNDLQSQLDKLQRLIALKNDQLARLEAQSGQSVDAAAPAAAPAPEAPAINAQLQSAPAETVVTPPPAAVDTAPVAEQPPADVQNPPAAADSASKPLDDLFASPLLLALIGASSLLVLLLLLLLLARKRKAQQEAEKHMRMARALNEESELGPDLDLPPGSFDGLEVAPPSVTLAPGVVAASAAAAVVAADEPEKPQPKPEPVTVVEPAAAIVPAPAPEPEPEPEVEPVVADASFAQPVIAASVADAILTEAEMSIARGRLNHAAELLEPAVEQNPQRSDLRLKLMEVYARQGDRDAFTGHERQLIATGQNHADVEGLKSRFPAMAAVAAAGIAGAAALTSELDPAFIDDLMADEPEQPAPAVPEALAEDDLDDAFDLSLDDELGGLELEAPAVEPVAELDEPAALDDLDFDSLFEEHAPAPAAEQPEAPVVPETPETPEVPEAAPVVAEAPVETPVEMPTLDDLADFDLDVGGDAAAVSPSEPVDIEAELAAFDRDLGLEADMPGFDLPEDFDLSLADETHSEAEAKFASELDDVNAELDKLSASLEQPSLEPHFTEEDAKADAAFDDLDMGDDFDFMGGTDVNATNLDLARAYIDMGDHDGARDILQEVVEGGSAAQKKEAEEMLGRLV